MGDLVLLAILLWAGLSLAACAPARPVVYAYPHLGFAVVKADPQTVHAACVRPGQVLDNGIPRTNRDRLIGCWIEASRTIWLAWDHPEVLIHELAHAEGIAQPDKEGYKW